MTRQTKGARWILVCGHEIWREESHNVLTENWEDTQSHDENRRLVGLFGGAFVACLHGCVGSSGCVMAI